MSVLVWLLGRYVFPLDPLWLMVATLNAALPAGANVYLIAQLYRTGVGLAIARRVARGGAGVGEVDGDVGGPEDVVEALGPLGDHDRALPEPLAEAEAVATEAAPAPAESPEEAINRIQQETAKALNAPAVKERLLANGAIPSGNTPAEFARMIEAELKKWQPVVKASGFRAD